MSNDQHDQHSQRTCTVVVAGPSGAGKSTVGALLAARLGWPMLEGDDLHPAANVAAMSSGHALTDAQRAPWLHAVAAWIGGEEAVGSNAVVTCSALTRAYRDVLRDGHPSVVFAELAVPRDALERRLRGRHGHWMPASLLDSQLGTLDPLHRDEPGAVVDADRPPEVVVDEIVDAVVEPFVRRRSTGSS